MSDWHAISLDDAAGRLAADTTSGLSREEAARRLVEYGPNELIEERSRSVWSIVWAQLSSLLIAVLIAAAAISAAMGDRLDAAAILTIVILNAAIGARQEYHAERAMAALRKLSAPQVKVRRDGELVEIPSTDIVPGDVFTLEAGSAVPADARLIETANLRMDESALTGESEPNEKSASDSVAPETVVGDRTNMVHRGTAATYGRGVALAVETGMRTELGRIAEMLQTVEREPTPLQRRLHQLGRILVLAALSICGIVFLLGLSRGEDLRLMFLTAVSLAVAAAPEGLPAVVTIALALGAQRMLKRNALIRRLPAVETLGSVTVICSDKTGTLTQNRMTVERILDAEGHELPTEGESTKNLILIAGALCNDAELEGHGAEPHVVGDPTEAAFVTAAALAGRLKPELEAAMPRRDEVPFDSERKRMTTVHAIHPDALAFLSALPGADQAAAVAFSKGALDSVAPLCSRKLTAGGLNAFGEAAHGEISAAHDRLAGSGKRVLALACRLFGEETEAANRDSIETEMIFLGLVAMIDPPRPEARQAVADCVSAGIRTVMITGDHPATAASIAAEIGVGDGGELLTGRDLDGISDEDLIRQVDQVGVYARVSPHHKLRIVQALQERGHTVAMTGDGVNDAPALKRSDIGVAMGVSGSDVSREASDMVLRDDNFATIVAAVKEGRVIFDNIRKFIKFLLSANSGELWVMLGGPLLGMPIPLAPLQILWMNLITDGPPALALSVEPPERDAMKREPYRPGESVFSRGLGWDILWSGLLMGSVSLGLGWRYWQAGEQHWQTMLFTTLTISQLALALAARSENKSLWSIGPWSNSAMVGALALSILLQLAVIYVEPLRLVFDTAPLSAEDLAVCVIAATALFAAMELKKRLRAALNDRDVLRL